VSSYKVSAVSALLFLNAWAAFSADKLIALTFDVLDDRHYEENVGITCSEAAEQLVRRGHELENHTYSHIELSGAETRRAVETLIDECNGRS